MYLLVVLREKKGEVGVVATSDLSDESFPDVAAVDLGVFVQKTEHRFQARLLDLDRLANGVERLFPTNSDALSIESVVNHARGRAKSGHERLIA